MSALPEKEFVGSRAKTATLLAISIAFVAIAVLLPDSARGSYEMSIAAALFFGFCALVFLWLLIRPHRIVVDSEGFAMVGGLVFSPKKTLWRDAEPFFVCRLANRRKVVGFNYRSGARDSSPLLKFNRRSAGADGALPILPRGSPEELVDQLNAYRERALAS